MCRILYFLLASILWITSLSASNKHNLSLSNLSNCKEYVINDVEYLYTKFIPITEFANNNNQTLGKGKVFHFKFIVMAGTSAHILFSAEKYPPKSNWVYEFILGGWNNTFSAYRLKLESTWYWQKPTPSLLGEFDPLPFEVMQDTDGLISVSIPGAKQFLYYFDKNPLQIRYVAFSAGVPSRYSRWYYDCQFDGSIMKKKRAIVPDTKLSNSNPLSPPLKDDNNSSKHHYYFMYHNNYYNN